MRRSLVAELKNTTAKAALAEKLCSVLQCVQTSDDTAMMVLDTNFQKFLFTIVLSASSYDVQTAGESVEETENGVQLNNSAVVSLPGCSPSP